jgi:hypothetical protein
MVRQARPVLVLLPLLGLLAVGCDDLSGPEDAVRAICDHGFAVSKPLPNVTVFVPQAGGTEHNVRDEQVLAIIPAIKRLHQFNALDLTGSGVTDRSLQALAQLPKLEKLAVTDTRVSEAGLEALRNLPHLRSITIAQGQFSSAQLAAIQAALPGVTITAVRPWRGDRFQ